jgi:hypothetical protein
MDRVSAHYPRRAFARESVPHQVTVASARVRPPIPVWLTIPPVAASPNVWLSRSRLAFKQPEGCIIAINGLTS